jgi:hypothetical protein
MNEQKQNEEQKNQNQNQKQKQNKNKYNLNLNNLSFKFQDCIVQMLKMNNSLVIQTKKDPTKISTWWITTINDNGKTSNSIIDSIY